MRLMDWRRRWVGVQVVWFWDCGSGVLESAGWKGGREGFGREENLVGGGCEVWGLRGRGRVCCWDFDVWGAKEAGA